MVPKPGESSVSIIKRNWDVTLYRLSRQPVLPVIEFFLVQKKPTWNSLKTYNDFQALNGFVYLVLNSIPANIQSCVPECPRHILKDRTL